MKSNKFLKLALVLTLLLATVVTAFASDEKFTTIDKLPTKAREFIIAHYATEPVISVKKDVDDDNEYEVIFKSGAKIKFEGNGRFDSVSTPQGVNLPVSLIALLPATVTSFIKDNYQAAQMVSLKSKNKGWEIGISGNHVSLVFDKHGKYMGAN